MNYRHAFHAGNGADVLKHLVLSLILQHLTAKPAPFAVLDTHAGIGRYDLDSEEARRTGEADRGILALRRGLSATDSAADLLLELAPYLDPVQKLAGVADLAAPLHSYPGSPCLARAFLRDQDRLILAELHPDDALTLKRLFHGDKQVAVHHMDGWTALKAHLPPKEKRGLVLIDPPFEAPDDFDRLVAGLALAYQRWPTGIYALWYPIKDRATVWRLHQALEDSGIPKIMAAELGWAADGEGDRLNGSGMIVVNPPWRLADTLRFLLPRLHALMGYQAGSVEIETISGEN